MNKQIYKQELIREERVTSKQAGDSMRSILEKISRNKKSAGKEKTNDKETTKE